MPNDHGTPHLCTLLRPEQMRPLPNPSVRDKLWRIVWLLGWALFYRLVPTPFHGLRCGILRLFGARIAAGALPYPSARIWAPWNLEMKSNSCIGSGVWCYNVD